jgi:anti-anti-sigma factor
MHVVRKREDVAIVAVDPALSKGDKDELEALKQLCTELQSDGCVHIVLDMSGLEYAPSLVLGSIIVLQKRIKTRDGELAILHPTGRLERILEITRMNKIIRVYDDEEEAIKALVRSS